MSTRKPTTGASLAKSNSSEMSFDDIYNRDDKEVEKEEKYLLNKKGKSVQLLAKINNIQMMIDKAQVQYKRSLVDPTQDSVAIAINIETMKKEEKIAIGIVKQLFPDMTIAESK